MDARVQDKNAHVIPIVPVTGDEVEVELYAARRKIYPRSVNGTFARLRWVFVWLTQLVFYGLPWLTWNGRQAVLFALESRRFYLFGLVLYPQDFIFLTGVLVVSALSLFLFTTLAGRLWCGYACPQTVYTEIFLWIEKVVEGDRAARLRLDRGSLAARLPRKALKHLLWGAVAMWTGFTFAGYFAPMRELGGAALAGALGPWQTFWILFYAFATYGNAGWMREQVCKYMCPYARFQSAMFDKDTMIVTYDPQRGEPRGPRGKNVDARAKGLGDCVACDVCVQVCPTGIDIRNGLQYECIGCGACADACNEVMSKFGYARGLVRYTTQNGIAAGWTRPQMLRRILRPRVLVYSSVLLAIAAAIGAGLYVRVPFKFDVIRDRGVLARVVEGGRIENVYRLQLMNATEATQQVRVGVEGMPGVAIVSEPVVEVPATEVRSLAVRVQVPPETADAGPHAIRFTVQSLSDPAIRLQEKSAFLVPR